MMGTGLRYEYVVSRDLDEAYGPTLKDWNARLETLVPDGIEMSVRLDRECGGNFEPLGWRIVNNCTSECIAECMVPDDIEAALWGAFYYTLEGGD